MLLISPTEAAMAIGAKCGGSAPSSEEPALLAILQYITARVEDSLNVFSLTLSESTERFYASFMPKYSAGVDQSMSIRLSNGFVVPDTVVMIDPLGEVVDMTTADIDNHLGVVNLSCWTHGAYTITYQSGFTPGDLIFPDDPDPVHTENRILVGIPEWMKAIAVSCLVVWYRTSFLSPRASKELSYGAVNQAIHQEISARIYGRYQRPRIGHLFTDRR